MILRKETNLYDDDAVANALQEEREYAESVNSKLVSTYGTCSTAAGTVGKSVTLAGFTLFTGARITVKFTYANTASNPTLNVNGTGAKAIWARNEAIVEKYYWTAQARVDFIYDGTHWVMPDARSQEEIFAEFTNNGAIRGIFMNNNQMYVNMDYLATGTIKLGGSNNGNGLLKIYNASGTEIGSWDRTGVVISSGSINLNSGRFVVDSNGNVTSKSLSASESITVYGGSGSSIYIPSFGNNGYCRFDEDGLLVKVDAHYVRCGRSATDDTHYEWNAFTISNGARSNATQRWEYDSYGMTVNYFGSVTAGLTSAGAFSAVTASITSNLTVGGTKSRIANTEAYGDRKLYCYETPSPIFGDIGDGVISDDGKCFVMIDSIFSKTITLSQYQVFLQKNGDGDCWVSEKTPSFFVVEGSPNLQFSWELKAKQKDFDQYRLEKTENEYNGLNDEVDYVMDLNNHIYDIQVEREVSA